MFFCPFALQVFGCEQNTSDVLPIMPYLCAISFIPDIMEATMTPEVRKQPILRQEVAFLLIHLLPLGALWTGATIFDWLMCLFFYVFRMFWITGGYHRYFAHKS